jgi:hypothetical protein
MTKPDPSKRSASSLDMGGDLTLDLGGDLDLAAAGPDLDLGPGRAGKLPDDPDEPPEEEQQPASYEEMHANTAGEIRTAFMERAAKDKQRYLEATDSEFWVAVCFRSREQKEAFLSAVRWPGVEVDDKYISGEVIAKALGIALPPARFVPPGQKANKDMVRLGVIGEE